MMFLMLSLAEIAIFVQIYAFYPTFGRKSTYFCPNLYFLPHIWTKIGFLFGSIEKNTRKGAQIDLVIKRVDKMIHLCEMKFSERPYPLKKEYEERLKERRALFMEVTGVTRGVVLTMITPYGLANDSANSLIHSQITCHHLFAD